MAIPEEVVTYLSELTDKEWAKLMQQVRLRREMLPPRPGGLPEHYVAARVTDVTSDDADVPGGYRTFDVDLLALADEDHYEGMGDRYADHAAEYGVCGCNGIRVASYVKNALCPVCGSKVYLT